MGSIGQKSFKEHMELLYSSDPVSDERSEPEIRGPRQAEEYAPETVIKFHESQLFNSNMSVRN